MNIGGRKKDHGRNRKGLIVEIKVRSSKICSDTGQ